MTNNDCESKSTSPSLIERLVENWKQSVLFRIICASISIIFLIFSVIFVLYLSTVIPIVCSAISVIEFLDCQSEKSEKTLQYVNEYRIEAMDHKNNLQTYFPGLTAVTAVTEDGKRVWTNFTRSASKDNTGNLVFRDHKIYTIIEPKHLNDSACILISPAKWPSTKSNKKDSKNSSKKRPIETDLRWRFSHIVLRTELLKHDKSQSSPIKLKWKNMGSDNSATLWVDGNFGNGLRGKLASSCSEELPSASARAQRYFLVEKAKAQSKIVSRDGIINKKFGWAYVGIIYEHRWFERYFDVDVTKAKKNLKEFEETLQYSYPTESRIIALGNVNLRKDHIKFTGKKWINQKIIGVICKDQAINVSKLKRVAEIGDTSDEYDKQKFDGFWWAKVSGDIGSKCE